MAATTHRTTATGMVIPDLFIHFTNERDAQAIITSGVLLLSRTIEDAVYAAPVGGSNVPTVQHACRTEAGDFLTNDTNPECRAAAVLFAAYDDPDEVFPEEAIWHRTEPLELAEAILLTAEEAEALLDGSAGITDDWAWPGL